MIFLEKTILEVGADGQEVEEQEEKGEEAEEQEGKSMSRDRKSFFRLA